MRTNLQQSAADTIGDTPRSFSGFEPLTSNYVYCPNQFFDVCLPHSSRGCIRIVASVLRGVLGWFDDEGNPIHKNIDLKHSRLIAKAHVSKGAIRTAIDESLRGNFIICVQQGRPARKGQSPQTACYGLKWDDRTDYIKVPDLFKGFFSGEGHRTPIPNLYFDYIIPNETLAVIKVVGTVLRHTVGYNTQFGHRPHAPLSYDHIQQYARIADRTTLSQAIQHSLETGYIRCIREGKFDPHNPLAAVYAPRWLTDADNCNSGSETRPVAVQKPDQTPKRFKNPTSGGSETRLSKRFRNQTIKKKSKNNTPKQQQAVAAENAESYRLLRDAGFDERIAHVLSTHSAEKVQKQIAWLEFRNVRDNKLGMLRKAIEQEWSPPVEAKRREKREKLRERLHHRQSKEVQEEARLNAQKKARFAHRDQLLERWQRLPNTERIRYQQFAIDQANSNFDRLRLQKNQDLQNPPYQVLQVMEADQAVAVGD